MVEQTKAGLSETVKSSCTETDIEIYPKILAIYLPHNYSFPRIHSNWRIIYYIVCLFVKSNSRWRPAFSEPVIQIVLAPDFAAMSQHTSGDPFLA